MGISGARGADGSETKWNRRVNISPVPFSILFRLARSKSTGLIRRVSRYLSVLLSTVTRLMRDWSPADKKKRSCESDVRKTSFYRRDAAHGDFAFLRLSSFAFLIRKYFFWIFEAQPMNYRASFASYLCKRPIIVHRPLFFFIRLFSSLFLTTSFLFFFAQMELGYSVKR